MNEILEAVKEIDALETAGFHSHSVLTSLGHATVIHGKKHHTGLLKLHRVHLCQMKTSPGVLLVTVPMFLPLSVNYSSLMLLWVYQQ